MIRTLADLGQMIADVARYSWRSGRWWMPLVIVVLAVGAAVLATAKVAVPVAVYTLF